MKKLKVIKCASCGAELEIKSTRSKFVNCQYCGNTTNLSGILVTVEKGDPEKFKPNSFLKLGMIGVFNDIPYKIIGRTCWRNDYKEYDYEDYQYYDETWRFDEWILLSDEGNYMTIIEDGEGYSKAKTITPIYPNIGNYDNIKNFKTGKSERANEFGNSSIEYFEGESTYLIKPGDNSKFSQYERYKESYIAEWREKDGKIFEIEFFKESPISKNKLLEAFKDNPELADLFEIIEKEKKASETNRKILLGFGIINLIIAIVFSTFSTKDKTVLFRNFTLHKNNWTTLSDTMLYAAGKFDKTLVLSDKAKEFSIFTSAVFPGYSVEIIPKLVLKDQQGNKIAEIEDYFYNYKDSTKKAINKSKLHRFKLDEGIKNMSISFRIEMPSRCLYLSEGTEISFLFQEEGTDYNTSLAYVLGILFLIVGIRRRKKKS